MCATLQVSQFKFYSLPWQVLQAGGIFIDFNGEKTHGNSEIVLR